MINFDNVSITYADTTTPVLHRTNLTVPEGDLCLVIGATGSGKSTLLKAINGLVPHFTGGTLQGRITVNGRDTATHRPRDLADVVGYVAQDPLSGFVTDSVEEELAYTMESLGVPPSVMRQRVEEVLDLLALSHLRNRAPRTLSGGERQRVAIGSVLTAHPRVIVLDEPTSALDPGAAEEVLAALQRLVHDLGLTIVLAEHRLERVLEFADSMIYLPGSGSPARIGSPEEIMDSSPIAPAVVRLARLAGWSPLPLSVRDARRHAQSLREEIALAPSSAAAGLPLQQERSIDVVDAEVRYGGTTAIAHVNLSASPSEVLAIMGRNGAGKSSLLGALAGARRLSQGSVRIDGVPPQSLRGQQLVRSVGMVPQEPMDLLTYTSVEREFAQADNDAGVTHGHTAQLLALFAPEVSAHDHPRDLSEGQRLALALAIVLAGKPRVIVLDEPTRGLDYAMKTRLASHLRVLATAGHTVVLATHDVELVADVATRVVVLAEGLVVADGGVAEIVLASPIFAPQVAKVLAHGGLAEKGIPLTPESVADILVAR